MADFALELSFTPADDARVRDAWVALQVAGLPSQADNARGMVNAPHLSLVVAREIPPLVLERGACFASVLPCEVAVRGLIVLGEGPRVTVAYLAEPPAQLARDVNELRSATPALRHPVDAARHLGATRPA